MSSYRVIQWLLRRITRTFFRRVRTAGLDLVPSHGGGIVVSWHPNGLIDPGLILTEFPRQIVFGARHGLFRIPLLGQLLKSVNTVPIFRAQDLPNLAADERRSANTKSLDALARAVGSGRFSALFPEGRSHDAPHLMELRTGAARLYYRACALRPADAPQPVILVVGLHYDDKDLFRSKALVEVHAPIELPEDLRYHDDLDDAALRTRCEKLTALFEQVLPEVVLATDNWELHHLMHRARKLIRAERSNRASADPGKVTMSERILGFARIRRGYYELLERDPDRVAPLLERVRAYDDMLASVGLEDHELDRSPRLISPWLVLPLVLKAFGLFFLLPPLLILGYTVNALPWIIVALITRLASRHRKDEATVKLLCGAVLFPAAWLTAGVLAGWGHWHFLSAIPSMDHHPALTAVTTMLVCAIGGAFAVRYLHVAGDTIRALRVRLTRKARRHAISELRTERSALHDALVAAVEGIELPGDVADDGRIVEMARTD